MASRFPRVRSYELMVIFHPEVEEEALGELVSRVQSYITDVDGTITVVNRDTPWGRRRLAYPIRHESRDLRDGYYVLYYFDTEASRTVEIEREIKLNTRIIRHMLIQQSTPTMEPPVPVEQAPPAQDGGAPAPAPASTGPAVASEASPGTPPEATPTPVEPMVADSAAAPATGEATGDLPTLDATAEPALPSETLPPADVSLVELATAADPVAETPAPAGDLSLENAPPEAVDIAEGNDPASADSTETPDEDTPATTPTA